MTNSNPDAKKSIDGLPTGVARIGVDGDGQTHYLDNPARDGRAVIVDDGDGLTRYDLEQMPGANDPDVDITERWHDYVAGKRGEWRTWTYGGSSGAIVTLADALEVQA